MSQVKLDLQKYVSESFKKPVRAAEYKTGGNLQPFLHWHPHYEICLILSGSYTVVCNNESISGSTPAIFLHAPYSLHSGNASVDSIYHRVILSIKPQVPAELGKTAMDMSMFAHADFIHAEPTPVELHELYEMMRQIILNQEDQLTAALYAALILRRVERILEDGRGTKLQSRFTYIQELLRYLGENVAENLTLDGLAARCGISKSKLMEDFKAATGMTYKKYLTTLRLTRAREMLLSGESIIRTSLECGYSSEAHFVKAFREYWGTTPGEFVRTLDVTKEKDR